MQSWGAVAAALILAGCGARAQTPAPTEIAVQAEAVPLDARDPARRTAGELTYAGGVVLTSPGVADFGGFSGIDVRDDGSFVSQSDTGVLLRGRLLTDADGRLTGVGEARLSPLLDEDGRVFARKALADAEDVTFLSDASRPDAFAIAFEGDVNRGRSRVSIYEGPNAPERVIYRAQWADTALKLGANYSFEALTQCPGEDTFLLGTEDGQIVRLDARTGRIENRSLVPQPPEDFKLTGLDCLAGGRLFAVYRAFDPFRGWRGMVARLTWAQGKRGPMLLRRELGRLEGSLTRDNMEGVAAVDRPDGRVRLYLISDDNFGGLGIPGMARQRTLLMAFDWTPPPSPR